MLDAATSGLQRGGGRISLGAVNAAELPTTIEGVRSYLAGLFADDLHAKRVASLAGAAIGVVKAVTLSVHAIGRGLASADQLEPRHAIKQVDRLLSNAGIDPWRLAARWVPYLVSLRAEILVAIDWTDFAADDQTTCAIHLITDHGRATPLLWKTVKKSALRGQRARVEDEMLMRLQEVVPPGVRVTVLADRGFADQALFEFLHDLHFDYVVRIKADTLVTDGSGETKKAGKWVGAGGRARKLTAALVSADKCPVGAVVAVHAKDMKDTWCLVTSLGDRPATEIIKLYGARWKIESGFRDIKNLRFGMGLSETRIGDPARRDRMLLVCAIGIVLLTVLGAAGESLGFERYLKANTVKTRSYSLFRQGMHYYELLGGMKPERTEALMHRFGELLAEQDLIFDTFATL